MERRVEYMPVDALKAAPKNPKLHAEEHLGESMGRFGYVEPIVFDERTGRLVAGHGRMEALRKLREAGKPRPNGVGEGEGGEWLIPVLRGWASKDDAEAEAYLLASNQLTTAGGWDNRELLSMLSELEASGTALLEGTGFDSTDIDALLKAQPVEVPGAEEKDPDALPSEEEVGKKIWVQKGDVYRLGAHRLMCGDATRGEDYALLMGEELADMCWTDPPWNVAYDGKQSMGKARKQPHAAISNDNMGEDFPGFCSLFAAEMAECLKPGAPLYLAMSSSEWPTIDGALRAANFKWSSSIVWVKESFVIGRRDYHSQYEPIWYGWLEGVARLAEVKDRTQSDVWNIRRPKSSDEHPTMKPVELIQRSLLNSSKRGAVVLEPFSGSGSTLIACERTGRACRAMELEPQYVQVAIVRWQNYTGRKAAKIRGV